MNREQYVRWELELIREQYGGNDIDYFTACERLGLDVEVNEVN